MTMGARIKQLREAAKLSQTDLGRIAGASDRAVSSWEKDLKVPRMGKIQAMADYFGVTKSYIIEGSTEVTVKGIKPMPSMNTVPRVGSIACGTPILAEQNVEGYDTAPDWVKADFSLVCKGDSMINAGIHDGDIVFIRQQEEVEPGQIAAVLIGEEATLKRVRPIDNGVALWPENPAYPPQVYTGKAAEDVHILGLATHCISVIR